MNLIKFILIGIGLFPSAASPEIENAPEPLNIVLSSTFGGRSHIKYLFQIAQHLRNRGHNIIYAAPEGNFKFNKLYNYTEYDVGGMTTSTTDMIRTLDTEKWIKDSKKVMPKFFTKIATEQYDASFSNYEKLYKTHKIDLIICDFFASVCSDSARKNNVPTISGFQGLFFGIGAAPFITNTMDTSPTTTESLSFYQRFKQAIIDPLEMAYLYSGMTKQMNQMRKKFGVPQHPNPWGAYDEVMKISNTYIGFDDPRPIESTVKLVGPVMDDHIPKLNDELQKLLDNYKALYVAFGSNAILTESLLQKLMGAMQLAIDNNVVEVVLWGLGNTRSEDFPATYEVNGQIYSSKSILDGSHPYIKALKWAPQTSILNHPNTKLFISHGGIESSHECVHSGTPILVMPIFGDQPRNARLIKNRGIGDFVNTLKTTPYELFDKIKELTKEDNYELQGKVKHIQSISHYHNSMRESNAKFLENYALSAKICRKTQPPKPFEVPCELEPYMQADFRMSFITAFKLDVLFALFSLGLVTAITIGFTTYRLIKLFVYSAIHSKQKHD